MKINKYLFLTFLLTRVLSGQIENVYDKNQVNMLPKYYQDFLNFASEQEGKTRLDIFIQVPYQEIQFVKSTKGFSAAYTVTVSVYDDEDKEKLLVEKSWKEKIDAIDFEQTVSKDNYNLSLKSFHLVPREYFIVTSVEDEDSRKKFASENLYNVRDLTKKVSISDLMLVSNQRYIEGSNKILPNVSRNITSKRDGIPMFFEIYSDNSSEVKIEFTIKDEDDDIIHKDTISKQLIPDRNQIIHTVKDISLGLGNYKITVVILDSSSNKVAAVDKSFISRWVGIPAAIQDLNKAVDQLVYIATPTDMSFIEELILVSVGSWIFFLPEIQVTFNLFILIF